MFHVVENNIGKFDPHSTTLNIVLTQILLDASYVFTVKFNMNTMDKHGKFHVPQMAVMLSSLNGI